MRHWPAALITAALVAAPGADAAAPKPRLARSYHGTLSGSFTSKSQDQTVKETWKVSGVGLRLQAIRPFEGGWQGLYKLTAGTVDFTATESGSCSFSAHDSFGLLKALPRPNPSIPLDLDTNPFGKRHLFGLITTERKLKTTETCPDPDGGEPSMSQRTLELPTLFDPGEKAWKPTGRLKGSNVSRDASSDFKSTEVWSWDLKSRA